MSKIKPKIDQRIFCSDGNAFSLMGKVAYALKENGYTKEEIDTFYKKAQAGDYNNLIRVCLEYVELTNDEDVDYEEDEDD